MHLRFNFDACPMHSPSGFVHLTHQNLSARALFCLNSLAKVNTQLLIYKWGTEESSVQWPSHPKEVCVSGAVSGFSVLWTGQKQKTVMLPTCGISEYLGRSVWIFFLNNFFKAPKNTKFRSIFHLFSHKVKKTHNLIKIGCIAETYFLNFYFWRWDGCWGQHNILFFFALCMVSEPLVSDWEINKSYKSDYSMLNQYLCELCFLFMKLLFASRRKLVKHD